MRLTHLHAERFLSLRDGSLDVQPLNVFAGANAAGKSNILDALRFLSEGVILRDFERPVCRRGGIVHLAWKGEEARQICLTTRYRNDERTFVWQVTLEREQTHAFRVIERLWDHTDLQTLLLEASGGTGWWWSGEAGARIPFALPPTHSPQLLAGLDVSRAVWIVRRIEGSTEIRREHDSDPPWRGMNIAAPEGAVPGRHADGDS